MCDIYYHCNICCFNYLLNAKVFILMFPISFMIPIKKSNIKSLLIEFYPLTMLNLLKLSAISPDSFVKELNFSIMVYMHIDINIFLSNINVYLIKTQPRTWAVYEFIILLFRTHYTRDQLWLFIRRTWKGTTGCLDGIK